MGQENGNGEGGQERAVVELKDRRLGNEGWGEEGRREGRGR